jgi:hypothetical protein
MYERRETRVDVVKTQLSSVGHDVLLIERIPQCRWEPRAFLRARARGGVLLCCGVLLPSCVCCGCGRESRSAMAEVFSLGVPTATTTVETARAHQCADYEQHACDITCIACTL